MLPDIAEVAEVSELPAANILQDIVEAGFARVERSTGEIAAGDTPPRIAGTEFIEMAVGPAQDRSEHEVQAVEADCESAPKRDTLGKSP